MEAETSHAVFLPMWTPIIVQMMWIWLLLWLPWQPSVKDDDEHLMSSYSGTNDILNYKLGIQSSWLHNEILIYLIYGLSWQHYEISSMILSEIAGHKKLKLCLTDPINKVTKRCICVSALVANMVAMVTVLKRPMPTWWTVSQELLNC